MSASAEELLAFWFGADLDAPEAVAERNRFWFEASPEQDREIAARFAELPELAARGALDAWRDAPRSALARVIALDQLPRNLYRDSPRAFASDAAALDVALDALARGSERALAPIERSFLYLPLEHAENPGLQGRSVKLYGELAASAPPQLKSALAGTLDYARRHRDVIARFGRFPARNRALGRASTPEETSFLAAHPEGY